MSNEPHKVSADFFEKLERDSIRIRKSQEEATFKGKLRRRKLFPIIKDGVLYIYSVKPSDETKCLIIKCREDLFDVYRIVTNDRKYIGDFLYRSSYFPEFRNVLDYHDSTKEDLIDYFNLTDLNEKNKFLDLPQNKLFKHDGMSFDDVFDDLVKSYMTFNFKRPSKISEIIDCVSRYFDADYAASSAYRILNSECEEFARGTNPVEDEQMRIDRMRYSEKENKLSYDERLELLKSVYNSFDIQCLYSSNVNEISDFVLENMFRTKSKKLIYDFAQHNYDLLYNSKFSDVYKKIVSSENVISNDDSKKLNKKNI